MKTMRLALPLIALCSTFAFSMAIAQSTTTPVAPASTAPATAPSRWEPHIAKFEAADREKMPEPGGVVFVGSSSIVGWKLGKAFPGINAINRGFGGSQASDAAHYAERIVIPYRPRLIVFYSGENDINAGKSPQSVLESFMHFVEKVRAAQPEVKIAFISLKPSPARWKHREAFAETNQLIRGFIEQEQNMTFIDIHPAMLGQDGQPRPDLFRDDMLHMNETGYAIWNERMRTLVEEEK